jgi:hypothetical protein
MTVGLYQKRPVTVEAVQWTGDNLEEIVEFAGDEVTWDVNRQALFLGDELYAVPVVKDDFIVRNSTGHVAVHSPDHFLATHVKVVGD